MILVCEDEPNDGVAVFTSLYSAITIGIGNFEQVFDHLVGHVDRGNMKTVELVKGKLTVVVRIDNFKNHVSYAV